MRKVSLRRRDVETLADTLGRNDGRAVLLDGQRDGLFYLYHALTATIQHQRVARYLPRFTACTQCWPLTRLWCQRSLHVARVAYFARPRCCHCRAVNRYYYVSSKLYHALYVLCG